jgi:hypothetical protein
MIGMVKNLEIKKNKDGKQDVLMLQLQVTEQRDIQSVQLEQSNYEMVPEIGDLIVIYKVNDSFKLGSIYQNGVLPDPSLKQGESRIYAKQGSSVKSFIRCRVNGEIELNGDSDWAVKFSALESLINELNSKFSNHIHPNGTPNTGTPTQPLDLDPSNLKVFTVRLP